MNTIKKHTIKILLIYTLLLVASLTKSQSVTVNPNPCDQKTLLSFTLSSGDTVTAQFFDLTSQSVMTTYSNTFLAAGVYNDSIFFNNLPSGIYYLSFKAKLSGNKVLKLIKQAPLGIIQIANSQQLKIHPNPVSNILNIEIGKMNEEISELNFIDISGRSIKKISMRGDNSVDVGDLSPGIYVLEATSKQNAWRKSFVKTE